MLAHNCVYRSKLDIKGLYKSFFTGKSHIVRPNSILLYISFFLYLYMFWQEHGPNDLSIWVIKREELQKVIKNSKPSWLKARYLYLLTIEVL